MDLLDKYLRSELDKRKESLGFRALPSERTGADFCSNDYLGLARDQAPGFQRAGGSTGSRLISGNNTEAEALESFLAQSHQAEAALLFSSGYLANLGLLSCVPTRHDTILYDAYVHASIRDGIALGKARAFAFRHNDLDDLEHKAHRASGRCFIVVESLYSMDGDLAPLEALCALSERWEASLIVDEAHATGIFGPGGAGRVVEAGLAEKVWARIHTFGKALGAQGAAVTGSQLLKDYLINFCRPFIYTTALPPSNWSRVLDNYRRIEDEPHRLTRLRSNIRRFLNGLTPAARNCLRSGETPIQSFLWPGNGEVCALADGLMKKGLNLLPIRSPTVPEGLERLRICLHAFNRTEDIDRLAKLLSETADRGIRPGRKNSVHHA